MKKFILGLITLFSATVGFNQERLDIKTETKAMSLGNNTAFVLDIPGGKMKEIEGLWGKYISRNTKAKATNIKGEWTINGASERNISANPINIYASILGTVDGTKLWVFFSEGDSNQIFYSKTESPEEKILAVEKYLTDFFHLAKRDLIQKELDAESKGLKALESDLKSMEKDFDKSKKIIGQSQRTIEKNESEIRRVEREIEIKASQVTQQKNAIATMTTLGDAKKVAEKDLKKFENEKKKLYSDKEKMGKEIDKCKAAIRAEERNVDKLNQTKAIKQTEVDKQADKVRSIEQRLNAVPNPGIKL